MPTQHSQSGAGPYWNRGFSPLFRGPYSDQHLRVSDAERQAVTDRLAEHFGDGRLDQAEFDERVGRAMNAKTRADLSGLFDDLPETGAPAMPERARRRRRHPILTIALLVLIAVAAVHTVAAVTMPWLWIGFLVVILLFATGTIGHSRRSQDGLRTGDGEHRPRI
jgi:Domain of unknown function (DUF1707)